MQCRAGKLNSLRHDALSTDSWGTAFTRKLSKTTRKKRRNQLPVLTDLWVRLLPLQKEKSTFFSARKDYQRIHEKQPVMQAFLIRLPCAGATYALINVSWLGEVHGMTNTLTDAAGVGNTAGQRTRAIAEVVLVYFPILVLISSTTRKLKKTKWDRNKKAA